MIMVMKFFLPRLEREEEIKVRNIHDCKLRCPDTAALYNISQDNGHSPSTNQELYSKFKDLKVIGFFGKREPDPTSLVKTEQKLVRTPFDFFFFFSILIQGRIRKILKIQLKSSNCFQTFAF